MTADRVFLGGRMHDPTAPAGAPAPDALAVAAGRIVAIGRVDEIAPLVGAATDVVRLDGGMLLPGFQDAHLHPLHGGLASLRCDLYATSRPDDHLAVIRAYAAARPHDDWLLGGGWSMDDFGGAMPSRRLLDEAAPGRAVALENRDGHSTWLSTAALERAGLFGEVALPHGAVVEREPDGTPAGTVHELGGWLEQRVLPPTAPADWDLALLGMQRELHALGITAIHEANATPELVEAYVRASEAGRLTIRVEGSLAWVPAEATTSSRISSSSAARRWGSGCGCAGPSSSRTASSRARRRRCSSPDRSVPGLAPDATGASLYAPGDLRRIVEALDREGFQVHVHTIGDRAVREALDALEAARAANGVRDARHHLAHVQFVHADDVPRFAALDVTANVTPLWAVSSGYVADLTLPFVTERAGATMYPFGSLHRAGARLAFGSDWSVSSPDPLLQLEVAVSRTLPGEKRWRPSCPTSASTCGRRSRRRRRGLPGSTASTG